MSPYPDDRHEHEIVDGYRYSPAAATEAAYNWLTNQGYAALTEVASPHDPTRRPPSRVIDLLGVGDGTGRLLSTVAVEVKVTRQDFVADIAVPDKQDRWRETAEVHYFAAPTGLLHARGIPDGSGLLEITRRRHPATGGEYNHVTIAKVAPVNTTPASPLVLYAQLVRRAAAAEAIMRGWATSGNQVVDLNAHVSRLQAELEREIGRSETYKQKAEALRALAARQGHKVPCAHCGAPIVPVRFNAGAFTTWRHAQPHLTTDCPGTKTGVTPKEDSL